MIGSSPPKWAWCGGALALAAISLATLAPAPWVFRTGVHWLVDHFVSYFAVTLLVCTAWRRPFVVALSLMLLAGLLEALQGLTLDRTPDVLSALSGAGGVLSAALVWMMMRLQRSPT